MRRRRLPTALAVLITVFLTLFGLGLGVGLAGPAVAGGPTSVLLVVPGEGRTASLYNTGKDYSTLATLLAIYSPPGGRTDPPMGADNDGASGAEDASGAGVTVTWMMHDVMVWRVDRVFVDARGGPLVSSQVDLSGGDSIWTKPAHWHRLADSTALLALLNRLGVGPVATVPAGDAASTTVFGATHLPGATPTPSATPATTGATRPTQTDADAAGMPGPDGWIWAPVGLLLGVLLTLALHRRRPTGTPTPTPTDLDVTFTPDTPTKTHQTPS